MNVGALSSMSMLWLNSQQKSRADAQADTSAAFTPSANLAAPASILPTGSAQLTLESLLMLQGEAVDPKVEEIRPPTATEIFLEEARKDPMERLREQIMEELGVSEEDLAAMPPEERRAMEDKIREMIEEKLRQAMNADQGAPQSNASMIEVVA